ncbi:MAG: clan AA aspartic protease [Chloroflexi bacterium]|nr:clan AA aspartic protease [Chloroflexota bacterium]MCY3587246.1 clan AA aspartic protease [Chloroflexota bacterium]MCY3685348.1 clan AA aspartic protease [Chloroflexota bacterium]MDE2707497.1 clan AA aspartic protease [Chloroflexota bacterium]
MLLTRAESEVQARWLRLIEEMPMGEVRVPVRLHNPYQPDRHWDGVFLVDSGATNSHVPTSILESIGIEPTGMREVWLADNRPIRRLISFAGFTVLEQTDYATVFFVDDDVEPILGLTVLESLGLLIDPARERLLPPSAVAD